MTHRILIEFVVDVPDEGVAGDVETRLQIEHQARLCDVLQSVTGYEPLRAPGQPGLLVSGEPVRWSDEYQDWIGPEDELDAAG